MRQFGGCRPDPEKRDHHQLEAIANTVAPSFMHKEKDMKKSPLLIALFAFALVGSTVDLPVA